MTPRTWLQRAPLLGFFALTFAWSWACWALSPAIRLQQPWLATLLMFAGSFGPSLAAVLEIPQMDREHMAGNHVLMRCAEADVLLGHLSPGSVRVRLGDAVATGG